MKELYGEKKWNRQRYERMKDDVAKEKYKKREITRLRKHSEAQ